VPEIFARYADRREGATSLASWLHERGYRTRTGKPFSTHTVLSILRNRSYLGEIPFRGRSFPAPHPPIIDGDLFERAQVILRERGEDHSLRRSNSSDYLLTGLVVCARCGKRYVGAAAHGNGGRYPYYVCHSRQRYGTKGCDNDRLPAAELAEAIMGQLLATLEREPLVQRAVRDAFAHLEHAKTKVDKQRRQIEAELRKVNETLDRYFHAFEAATMPEQACAPRIAALTDKLAGLEARHAELANEDTDQPEPLSEDDLRALTRHAQAVIDHGDPAQLKTLLQAMVAEIKVASRSEIYPYFSLPVVRPPSTSVAPGGIEAACKSWVFRFRGRHGGRHRAGTREHV
jgi:site-specific DNA recombinase